jgi:CheY-like chemotaxis protein
MVTRTILVADDDENDVLLMERAFARARSQAALQFVPNGEEALAYLRGQGRYSDRKRFPFPALLLLDLKMPRKNGLEVLEVVRNDPQLKKLTVVIFTASNQERDIDLALGLGANSYLVKPTNPESLASLLHRVEDYWLSLNQNTVTPERELESQI